MTDYQHLRVETSPEGIRTIVLDRPDRLNAVNDALAFSVGDALADAGADDAVRVVVITGAGRAFCAGLDLAEPPALPHATRADRLDPYAWVGTWVQRVVACDRKTRRPSTEGQRFGPADGRGECTVLAAIGPEQFSQLGGKRRRRGRGGSGRDHDRRACQRYRLRR